METGRIPRDGDVTIEDIQNIEKYEKELEGLWKNADKAEAAMNKAGDVVTADSAKIANLSGELKVAEGAASKFGQAFAGLKAAAPYIAIVVAAIVALVSVIKTAVKEIPKLFEGIKEGARILGQLTFSIGRIMWQLKSCSSYHRENWRRCSYGLEQI